MNNKIIILFTLFALSMNITAKDYKASLFGIKSDGATLNTESIQYAIDHISKNGGGKLVFYVGRYLTGSIYLKPNVTIQLQEGAVLVAFESIYDFFELNHTKALILADSVENIGITGKGVIEGRGNELLKNISNQIQKGFLDNTDLQKKPSLIHFNECSNITLDGIILRDACGDVQSFTKCKNMIINNITIESKAVSDSKGIVISNCDGVVLSNSYLDTTGKELSSKKISNNTTVKETINPKGKKLQF